MDYNSNFAAKALQLLPDSPKRILIVGAGSGGRYIQIFNELTPGNVEIHGLDIVSDVGVNYSASNVCYLCASVTNMPYRSQYFDLVYSFASFEHIHDISLAWQSMINVLKPGGVIYTIASPLWCSPWGHHKSDIFRLQPWIHLLYPEPDKLYAHASGIGLQSNDDIDLIHHINYMMNDEYFNKLKVSDYEVAARMQTGLSVKSSEFFKIEKVQHNNYDLALERGYSQDDLLSSTHIFYGVKS